MDLGNGPKQSDEVTFRGFSNGVLNGDSDSGRTNPARAAYSALGPSLPRGLFRFCFVYFGLFCLATQILGGLFPIPKVDIPDPATLWPMLHIIFWTAAHNTFPAGRSSVGS